jgi:hypothetical protein
MKRLRDFCKRSKSVARLTGAAVDEKNLHKKFKIQN